ncbi:protein mab-21-like 4 isoform X1 [Stegostoma tigrinum]|uniref:protein mab-21-like 4 isoform X1 n=2 Tax=Stegostoma tigrinum TaxID=3053191 RepID=UPI00202B9C9A|nr:protein mab-21-like 4 isoform X1 [Stegostoma tigrinum]
MWSSNSDRLSWYQRYLSGIKAHHDMKATDIQKCEDTLFTILDRVQQQDYRFQVDYSREHACFDYTIRTQLDELDMEVSLWFNDPTLRVEESCDTHYVVDGISHQTASKKGLAYLTVPKESESRWTGSDIFHPLPESSQCSGHLVPGRVINVLKELLKGAIVYCQQNFLINPGEVNASLLNFDGPRLTLVLRNLTKPLRVNIIPVLRKATEKLLESGFRNEKSFLETTSQATPENLDISNGTYYRWRYCFERPMWKLLEKADADGGHRMDSLCLLDRIKTDHWLPGEHKRGLTFNMLKMVLLWAMKFFPAPEDWIDLESSVYRMVVVLLRCLALQNLPNYFMHEINLFQENFQAQFDFQTIYKKVQGFADTPEKFLQIHLTHLLPVPRQHIDSYLKMLLQIQDNEGLYWNTAYFDIILNKFQVYHVLDADRIGAMQLMWAKTTKLVTDEGCSS